MDGSGNKKSVVGEGLVGSNRGKDKEGDEESGLVGKIKEIGSRKG